MSRRQKARRLREAAHWAGKQAAAPTAAARAAVAFDRLRALLADLPPEVRERAWSRVEAALNELARDLAESHAPSPGP